MAQDKQKTAAVDTTLTQDQRDQLAVDAMLPKLSPKGWSALKSYLHGCLDMAAELESKSA